MLPEGEARPAPEEHLGLAHLCARRFQGRGVEYDDLFQAACLGLVKAADGYDPARGTAFSTYAVPVILGEIKKLFREGGALRISRGMRELAKKALEAAEQIAAETGRPAGLSEIALRLGVSPERAALALGAGRPLLSLSGEDGDAPEIPVEAPEEAVTQRLALRESLARLEERDRQLIDCRYFRGKTQNETGRLLGMSQVQVSRREKKLLLLLREALN